MKQIAFLLFWGVFAFPMLLTAQTNSQMQASMLMNDCVYTLSRIKKSDNKIVLEREQNKLINELGWENVSKYPYITQYRQSLNTELNGLIQNDRDKELFCRVFERKKNNVARDAVLGAISGVQINTNWMAVASNALISSARAFMDYKKRTDDIDDEFEEGMWDFEKNEMNAITSLRNEAFNVINDAFGKENLKENMRITESDVENFLSILEEDPELRAENLQRKKDKFKYFQPFWYELGAAYIDVYVNGGEKNNNILQKAWDSFAEYEKMTKTCKLYRHDEQLAMICVYKLKYKKGLSADNKVSLIKTAVSNNIENGNIILCCALEYFKMGNHKSGFALLSETVSNPKVTAKNEMLLVAAANWNKLKDTNTKNYFINAVCKESVKGIDFSSFLVLLFEIEKDGSANATKMVKLIEDPYIWRECHYYCNMTIDFETEKFNYSKNEWDVHEVYSKKTLKELAELNKSHPGDSCEFSSCPYFPFFPKEVHLFASIDDLAKKMPYYEEKKNRTPEKLNELKKWISVIEINGEWMYYWDKNKTLKNDQAFEMFYYEKITEEYSEDATKKIQKAKNQFRDDFAEFIDDYGTSSSIL